MTEKGKKPKGEVIAEGAEIVWSAQDRDYAPHDSSKDLQAMQSAAAGLEEQAREKTAEHKRRRSKKEGDERAKPGEPGYVEISQRGALTDPESESEMYKAQGLAAAKGTGIPSARYSPIDNELDQAAKYIKFYDLHKELFGRLLGADGDIAAEVQNLKNTIGDDLLKDFPMELVQMKSERYNQAEGLARVAVMSMMGGMMQTMAGGQGSVPVAGMEGMASGIQSIQERTDKVDQFNRAVDEKNAELAREYYLKADQWAKDYNQIYTKMEQVKNKFAIDALNDRRKHWAKMIEESGKTLRAIGKDVVDDTKSKRDIEKARMQSQASIDIARSRSAMDTARLYLGLSEDAKALEDRGMWRPGDLESTMSLASILGLSPASTAISVAGFFNYEVRNETDAYRLKQISAAASDDADQMIKAAGIASDKSVSWYNPFSWGRGEEAKKDALNFMVSLSSLGINLNADGKNRVANSFRGDGLQVNYDSETFLAITNNPAIKDMLRGGEMTRPTDTESLKHHLNQLMEMRAMAIKYDRGDVVVEIDNYANRLVGGITADGEMLGGFVDEYLTGWSGATNRERQLYGGAVNYHVLNRLSKDISEADKQAHLERLRIQGDKK